MARGQKQMLDQQIGTANSLGSQQYQQGQQLENKLIPDYESLMQGYSPTQESAITTAGMGALGSSYGSSAIDAGREAARTNNPASTGALQDEMAQQKGEAMGQEAAGLQSEFANQQQKDEQAGLTGLSDLQRENANMGLGYYGQVPGLLSTRGRINPGGPGGLNIGGILGGAGSVLSGIAALKGGGGGGG